MDSQKRYIKIMKESAKLAILLMLSIKDQNKITNCIESFIAANVAPARNIRDEQLAQFCKDLERRLAKVNNIHSKEALSKFIQFLENCPNTLVEYRV